jgi:hypothetical protein
MSSVRIYGREDRQRLHGGLDRRDYGTVLIGKGIHLTLANFFTLLHADHSDEVNWRYQKSLIQRFTNRTRTVLPVAARKCKDCQVTLTEKWHRTGIYSVDVMCDGCCKSDSILHDYEDESRKTGVRAASSSISKRRQRHETGTFAASCSTSEPLQRCAARKRARCVNHKLQCDKALPYCSNCPEGTCKNRVDNLSLPASESICTFCAALKYAVAFDGSIVCDGKMPCETCKEYNRGASCRIKWKAVAA